MDFLIRSQEFPIGSGFATAGATVAPFPFTSPFLFAVTFHFFILFAMAPQSSTADATLTVLLELVLLAMALSYGRHDRPVGGATALRPHTFTPQSLAPSSMLRPLVMHPVPANIERLRQGLRHFHFPFHFSLCLGTCRLIFSQIENQNELSVG